MYGLTVRWSLRETSEQAAQQLRDYVTQTSLEGFSGMAGLSYKTWRMRPGEWFEGTYVWADEARRDAFRTAFSEQAATSQGSVLVGSPPELIETFEVVAVAEGGTGFAAGPGPGRG